MRQLSLTQMWMEARSQIMPIQIPIHTKSLGGGSEMARIPPRPTERGTFLFQIQLFHIETAIRWLRSATGSVHMYIKVAGVCENGRQNESQLVFLVFFLYFSFCFHLFVLPAFLFPSSASEEKKEKLSPHRGTQRAAHVKKLLCALGHSFVRAGIKYSILHRSQHRTFNNIKVPPPCGQGEGGYTAMLTEMREQ